jgi:anti-sigma factor RsiW
MSHSKISELLPWYVNGSLDIGDRQAAALEVASCDECGKDVEELTKLQASMLELEALAPEPSEYGLTRALAAVEAEEEKKRLGHPWFGWWWALTPFRRALTVSSILGALVVGSIIFPHESGFTPTIVASNQAPTPISLDEIALSSAGAASRAAVNGAAPIPMPLNEKAAVTSSVPSLRADTQIARTGSVSLLVPDVETAIAKISGAAQMQGGVVLSLNDQTPSQPGERHTAQLQIGVPVSRFDATIGALGRFGGLQSRSVSAENVATQIVDAQARLHNLRSTESDLLNIMSRAGKIDEVLSVENQVSATREQIEQLDGEVQALKHRVAMSTVTIFLEDEVPAMAVDVGVGPQLRDSWNSALRSVRNFTVAIVGGILWGVAYGPYVLALALAGGLIAMRWRR